jgi:hypothetical protein
MHFPIIEVEAEAEVYNRRALIDQVETRIEEKGGIRKK